MAIKDTIYERLQSDAESGHFDMDSLTIDEYGFGYPRVAADCPSGTLFRNKATTISFSCGENMFSCLFFWYTFISNVAKSSKV